MGDREKDIIEIIPITIVMPVHDRAEYLVEAIESVLAQDYPLYELFIVDDGSTRPQVKEIIEGYRSHPLITMLRKEHGGPGSAVNRGAANVKTAYFCRLDSDDKLAPPALSKLNDYFHRYPEVSCFYSSRYVINAASEVVVGKWIPPDGIHRSLPFDRKRLLREFFCNHLICWKTEDYLEVKGMREDLMWAEDWDLALRMARRFTFQNIPDPLYYVREYEGARLTRQVDEEKKADIVREVLCAAQTAEILDHRHPAELHMSYVKALRKTTRNVLLINNEVDLYGGELCLLDLARSLQGYRPVVILPRKGPLQALLEKAGIPVLIFNFQEGEKSLERDKRCFQFLQQTIEAYAIDVLHLNKVFDYMAEARIVTWLKGIPLLVHVRGAVDIEQYRKKWLHRADYILFVCEHAREHLMRGYPDRFVSTVPGENIRIVYDGRNLENYAYSEANRREMRRALSLGEQEIVIVLVGYFDPIKGQHKFVELARRLLRERKDLKFLLIGDVVNPQFEGYRAGVVKQIRDLGLEDRIQRTGFLDCRKALSATDILVSLSDTEGLPGVLIEAMAARRCVVANRVGGIPEIIGEDEAGFCVDKDALDEMERIILSLADDPARRQRIGDKARERVGRMFPLDRHVKRMESLYESARVWAMNESFLKQKKAVAYMRAHGNKERWA